MSKSELLGVYIEKNSHQEKRVFVCSLCSYRTDRRNNLKRHTATMHELSTAVLECCGNRFANKAALRHHTAAYHRNGYICTICARMFCRRALLRRHHAVHSGYKEFTCSFCDYATSHKSNLERHMKIHESSEKFSTSPSSMGHSSLLHDRSSPDEDYYNLDDSNKSCQTSPQSRGHNPILASLLSQPTHDGEIIQWLYHSPYDSYSSQVLNLSSSVAVVDGSHGTSEIQDASSSAHCWSYSCLREESEHRKAPNLYVTPKPEISQLSHTVTSSSVPLRHTIDVILGIREDLSKPCVSVNEGNFPTSFHANDATFVRDASYIVTSAPNHWSIGHLSSPESLRRDDSVGFLDEAMDASQNGHVSICDTETSGDQLCNSNGHKRQRHLPKSYPSSQTEVYVEGSTDDVTYVPKKLRMSKRYQRNALP